MKKEEFRNWLTLNRNIKHPGDYISKIKNIEKYYGDIDEIYNNDKCTELSTFFVYSEKDRTDKISPRHLVPIEKYQNKDIYETYLNTTQDYRTRLNRYIDFRNSEHANLCMYPESDNIDKYHEGAKITVEVNKHERNSSARVKCITYHGCYCHVCGINFEDIYGEIGRNFIHVHHIVPLNEINEEYSVNPETDLIPVCPNCHAMLHKKLNGKYISVFELKELLTK